MIKFICLLLISFSLHSSWAASCCGGSVAAPALISGDDRAQISVSVGRSEISDDVYPNQTWQARDYKETSEIWTLEAAHIFKDRWQAGLSLPVVRRARENSSSSGMGDVTANLAYEYLPDWDFNPYRPRGLGFLQLIAPAGRAVFESREAYLLDTRGRGFWALGAGTLLSKFWGPWDALAIFSVHQSFARADVTPGLGGAVGFGGGYTYKSWRAGTNLNWSYEDPMNRGGSMPSRGSAQRYATAVAALSYIADEEWSGTLSFQDQTLFGSPVNTNLGRGVQLQIQRRWSR